MTRVLLTNDDGASSPGFLALVESVLLLGFEACIAVPKAPMSGASRSRCSNVTYEYESVLIRGIGGFAVEAPPAACVVFGMTSGLLRSTDLVLCGVNAGENIGSDLGVSGTFGAATEAGLAGVKSIAISREYGGEMGSEPGTWDWSDIPKKAAAAIGWCLGESGWITANVNLANADDAMHPPVQTRISQASHFATTYDVNSKTLRAARMQGANGGSKGDDVHTLDVLKRTGVTLIDRDHLPW